MDGTSPFNVAIYAMLLFLMGLSIAAAAPACNNPVFAEIVPPELRNMVQRTPPSAVCSALKHFVTPKPHPVLCEA